MAKYAINEEGVESLNRLANDLCINANNIVEANQRLEQMVFSLYESLGIFGDEIISVIRQNRQTLNRSKEDVIMLAQKVKKQAQDIEDMVTTKLGETDSIGHGRRSGIGGMLDVILGKNRVSQEDDSFVSFGKNLTASRSKVNSEVYFVNGSHSADFIEYWEHVNEYLPLPSDEDFIRYINAKDIEGIYVSSQDIHDVEGFWGRRTGGTQDTFVEIARNIPKVKSLLDSGMNYNDIRYEHPELSDCVDIYFESAPSVSALNDFYVFGGSGRHRELAAQSIDGIIPVRVTKIITRK